MPHHLRFAPGRRDLAKLACGAIGLSLPALPARAGTIEVAPIITDMVAGQSSSVLTVTNRNPQGVAIQLRGFQWSQPAGSDVLTPATELVISPPMFQLAPNVSQTVRLLLRGGAAPADRERSYRLLVDEIPEPGDGGQVRFALRLSLPVFARGNAPAALVEWGWTPDGQLSAINRGGRHTRLAELRLSLPGAGAITLPPAETPYLLAGAARRWALPRPGPLRGATISGLSAAGPFRTEVAEHASLAP
jgi:fimbrial chaperone protein